MPELPAVGRVENPDELDLDPIVVPVVGYTLDRQEVVEKFTFRPTMPAGEWFDIVNDADNLGVITDHKLARYLLAALVDDKERERWSTFLHRNDIIFPVSRLGDLYSTLTEYYAARPTMRPAASRGTRPTTRRTSGAARRSPASRSNTSRSR